MKKNLLFIVLCLFITPLHADDDCYPPLSHDMYYRQWYPLRIKFGTEVLTCRFPSRPYESQSDTLKTAQADADGVKYCLMGFFPARGSIDAQAWFAATRASISQYPYACISFSFYKEGEDVWVLDYKAHDTVLNEEVITRAYVTPFNAYTLQCRKSLGVPDDFEYFIDNCFIRHSE